MCLRSEVTLWSVESPSWQTLSLRYRGICQSKAQVEDSCARRGRSHALQFDHWPTIRLIGSELYLGHRWSIRRVWILSPANRSSLYSTKCWRCYTSQLWCLSVSSKGPWLSVWWSNNNGFYQCWDSLAIRRTWQDCYGQTCTKSRSLERQLSFEAWRHKTRNCQAEAYRSNLSRALGFFRRCYRT